MNAIITGSRAYGNPRPDSDIDLVVLMSPDDYMNLMGFAIMEKNVDSNIKDSETEYGIGANSAVLRFGQLNLLVTVDPLQFEVWRRGTEQLKQYRTQMNKPVSRELAVSHLTNLRKHCGVRNPEPKIGVDYDDTDDD